MITVEIKQDNAPVGVLTAPEKVFKTGSRGFFGMGKIEIAGKRYQVQVQLVGETNHKGTKTRRIQEKYLWILCPGDFVVIS